MTNLAQQKDIACFSPPKIDNSLIFLNKSFIKLLCFVDILHFCLFQQKLPFSKHYLSYSFRYTKPKSIHLRFKLHPIV